jgi:tetratricopeptide (TPR) repeat protein
MKLLKRKRELHVFCSLPLKGLILFFSVVFLISSLFAFPSSGFATSGPAGTRLKVALMGFSDENQDQTTISWQIGLNWSIFSALKTIRRIHVLPTDNVDSELKLPANFPANITNMEKIGREINAESVVWGSYLYAKKTWAIKLHTLNLESGNDQTTFFIISTNWNKVQFDLARDVFQALGFRPTRVQLQALRKHLTVSADALEDYDNAELLDDEGGSTEEQIRFMRLAVQSDPNFAEPYSRLAQLLCINGDTDAAEKAAAASLRISPDSADGHCRYSDVLFSERKYRKAKEELSIATQLDPDDADAFERLADIEILTGEASSAVTNYTYGLQLDPYSPSRQYLQKQIKYCSVREWPVFFTNAQPKYYTCLSLRNELVRRLTPAELKLVQDPLSLNDQMRQWSKKLTSGATNDCEKARILFQEIVQHVYNGDSSLELTNPLTAEEIFSNLDTPNFSLNCQEATFLYVALAKAVGLKSFCVQVDQDYEGRKTLHACAGVYVGDKLLLVDPACFWFGAPHQKFVVLSDVQAIGVYLSMSPYLERRQIAAKLAPQIPLVLFNLCLILVENKEQDKAKQLLPFLKTCDTDGALTACLEGDIALHEGQNVRAIRLFQKAIEIDPEEAFFMQLARVYLADGKVAEANGPLEEALKTNHTAEDAEEIENDFLVINRKVQNYYEGGKRDFKRGDFSSAVTNFDTAIKIKPDLAEAYAFRGCAEEAQSNLDDALADYSKAIELETNMPEVYLDRGFLEQRRNDPTNAIVDYGKAIGLKPDWAVAYKYRGYLEQQCSNLDAALADDNKAIQLKPDFAEVYSYRASVEFAKNDLADAETDIAEAAKLNSDLTSNAETALEFFAWSRYQRQEYGDASADFKSARDLNPSDDYAHFGIFLSESRLGETKSATEDLKLYLEARKPKNSGDWPSPIGRFLAGQITEQELLAAAEDVDSKKDREQKCEAYFYIGSRHLIAGDKARAEDFFEKCVATGIQNFSEYQCAKVELNTLGKAN